MNNLTEVDNKISILNQRVLGNIIDHNWYNLIKTPAGRSYMSAVSLLSEIVYWFRPARNATSKSTNKFIGDAWQTSYAHFIRKFGLSHETTRRALVKLEELGIIRREFRNIKIRGQIFNNVLFIHLGPNIHQFLSKDNAQSAFLKPKLEDPYPQNVGDHIYMKIKKRNRSSNKSNFDKIEKEKLTVVEKVKTDTFDVNQSNFVYKSLVNKKPKTIFSKILGKFSLIKRPLKEYLPITKETAEKLNHLSGREFSCHFINKLAEKLGNKNAELKFYKEELFLRYMSKVLKNEMRNPYLVNNINFKFKADSEEEQQGKKINQYLDEVERSTLMTEEARLRRKIVGICEESVAYNLLTTMSIAKKEDKLIINHKNFSYNSHTQLNQTQKDQLLKEVRLIYRNQIKTIEWKVEEKLQTQKDCVVASMSSNMSNNITNNTSNNSSKNNNINDINYEKNLLDNLINRNLETENNQTSWSKVKLELIKIYGINTYVSWFSKLSAEEDLGKKALTLKAPTEFIKQWIKTNYQKGIEEIGQNLSIQVIYE